jgi:hypothetical protein
MVFRSIFSPQTTAQQLEQKAQDIVAQEATTAPPALPLLHTTTEHVSRLCLQLSTLAPPASQMPALQHVAQCSACACAGRGRHASAAAQPQDDKQPALACHHAAAQRPPANAAGGHAGHRQHSRHRNRHPCGQRDHDSSANAGTHGCALSFLPATSSCSHIVVHCQLHCVCTAQDAVLCPLQGQQLFVAQQPQAGHVMDQQQPHQQQHVVTHMVSLPSTSMAALQQQQQQQQHQQQQQLPASAFQQVSRSPPAAEAFIVCCR